jgi:hypothetical protein
MSGDTRPTLPLPFDTGEETDAAPRRRRRWPWLVAVLVVLLLLVGAALAGEWLARDVVTKGVTQAAVSGLGAPADTEIDVDIPGSLLFQLATGTIGEATVSSPDIAIDGFSGGVTATVRDLQIAAGPAISGGTATVVLDAAQLRALMSTVEDFPAYSLGLAAPNVTASTDVNVLGLAVPVGIGLTPSAEQGDLVLTPAALTLGDAQVSAEDLRSRLGSLADGVLKDWRVCIAQYLPAALTLSGVEVSGEHLVARFDIAGGVLTEASMGSKGTCD